MLRELQIPRIVLPRSSRGFSHSLSSPGSAKPQRKPAHARRTQPSPTHLYARLETEESLLHIQTASKYYPPRGQSSHSAMEQPRMDQSNGFENQGMKGNSSGQLHGGMAQPNQNQLQQFGEPSRASSHQPYAQHAGVSPFNGGDGHLTQGNQQQTFPNWGPGPANANSHGVNTGMHFQGGQIQYSDSAFSMGPAQPHNASGFPPRSFTPSLAMPSNMNTGSSTPSQPTWPPASSSQIPPQADNNRFLWDQLVSSARQNGATRPSIPTQQASNTSSMPATKKATSAAENRHRLEITAPSKQSGGVPDPTDAYLMRASFLPKRRDQPGPLLVVIDLNGTLLYRPSRKNLTSFQSRLHAKEFVTYCVQTFWVVFWSSAKPENVKGMVDQLLTKSLRKQVVGVWGRDKFGLTEQDYNKRTQCYKRLTTLWNDPIIKSAYPSRRPGFEGGCWDQGNTVLIDDSIEKARSEPHNAITLPEYVGGTDDAGDVLPSVHDYLNELCFQEDVSAFMRAHPFRMV